jgi:hypothetical protein
MKARKNPVPKKPSRAKPVDVRPAENAPPPAPAPPAAAKKRVFVVDDHPIVRERLAELIGQESDLEVCGEAEDAITALKAIEAGAPTSPSWTSRSRTPTASS